MGFLYAFGFLEVLTVLMVIDCAINHRDLYWFMILVFLGPLGGLAYTIYHWHHVTFPFRFAQLGARGGASTIRRCPRCYRPAAQLLPYEDGRRTLMLCPMCVAEMDFARSGTLTFKN